MKQFIFSSTAAVIRHAAGRCPDQRGGRAGTGHALRQVQADERVDAGGHGRPRMACPMPSCAISTSPDAIRSGGGPGSRTPGATHLLKVACEAALGKRSHIEVFGTDYPTPDGSGIRDFIHVSDLVAAHRLALGALRADGASMTVNCGAMGTANSVLEVSRQRPAGSGRTIDVRMAPAPQGRPRLRHRGHHAHSRKAGICASARRSGHDRRHRTRVGRGLDAHGRTSRADAGCRLTGPQPRGFVGPGNGLSRASAAPPRRPA